MKSKKVLAALLALSLTATTGFMGCGNKQATNSEPNKAANTASTNTKSDAGEKKQDEPKAEKEKMDKEQYASVVLGAEPRSIDPSRSSDGYSTNILAHVLEGLTRNENWGEGDQIVPGIAESWESNPEGTVWTFHLRDAVWEDDKPVTAQDYEYGIKRTLNPETGSPYAWIITPVIKNADAYNTGKCEADAVGVKAINDKTLEITLESPCAYFLSLTSFKVMLPQRKDMVEKYGDAYGSEAEHMLACGPFKAVNWLHQSKFEMVKNEKYWDADSVKLQKLTWKVITDENARMNEIFNGGLDAGGCTKPEWMDRFNKSGNFEYRKKPLAAVVYEYFNQDNKYLKNAKIRKALICALNREELNNTLYRGKYEPAFSWIPPSVMINGESFREKANSEPIKKLLEKNPDPKALLIEGLNELGEDPDPSKVVLTMLEGGTAARDREFAEFRQQVYKTVLGIDVKVEYCEWAIFDERTTNGDFEIASASWWGDYNDPNTFLEIFKSDANVIYTGFKNDEYDKLITEAAQTMDQEKRFENFKKAEQILLHDEGVISTWVVFSTSTFVHKYLKNYHQPVFSNDIDMKHAYTVGRDK